MLKVGFSFAAVSLAFSANPGAAQQLNLPNTLCGPPLEVIAAVEARGFVNDPIYNVLIPDEIANRADYALLAFTLGPKGIAAQIKKGGYVTQRILWILRTDREPLHPKGWACVYNETPVSEQDREEALQRGRDVQTWMSKN